MTDHLLLKTLRILSATILIEKRIGIVFFWMGEHADDRKIRLHFGALALTSANRPRD